MHSRPRLIPSSKLCELAQFFQPEIHEDLFALWRQKWRFFFKVLFEMCRVSKPGDCNSTVATAVLCARSSVASLGIFPKLPIVKLFKTRKIFKKNWGRPLSTYLPFPYRANKWSEKIIGGSTFFPKKWYQEQFWSILTLTNLHFIDFIYVKLRYKYHKFFLSKATTTLAHCFTLFLLVQTRKIKRCSTSLFESERLHCIFLPRKIQCVGKKIPWCVTKGKDFRITM